MKAKTDLKNLFSKTFAALKKEITINDRVDCFDDLCGRYSVQQSKEKKVYVPNFLAIPAPVIMQRMVR